MTDIFFDIEGDMMLHRLNNFKVTGGTHLGWGWGGLGKITVKVTDQGQGHVKVTFKVKYKKKHSEGHSTSFQGQT